MKEMYTSVKPDTLIEEAETIVATVFRLLRVSWRLYANKLCFHSLSRSRHDKLHFTATDYPFYTCAPKSKLYKDDAALEMWRIKKNVAMQVKTFVFIGKI